MSNSFTIGAACLHVGATIGIACGPDDGAREEQLMRAADLALYRAKDAGRGGYAFFERYMFDEAEDHRLLEQDVRTALHEDGLRLAYQPIVDAQTRRRSRARGACCAGAIRRAARSRPTCSCRSSRMPA